MKKVISNIINVICFIIIGCAVILMVSVVFSRGSSQPSFFGYSLFRVVSESMEPEIPVNSLIIIERVEDVSTLEVGDVITFRSLDPTLGGAPNTHRIKEISVAGEDDEYGKPAGTIVFTTKGDNNILEDKFPVYEDAVIGKVAFVSHIIGIGLKLLTNPLVFGALIIIPLLLIAIVNIKDLVKTAKNMTDEELLELSGELERQRKNEGDGPAE